MPLAIFDCDGVLIDSEFIAARVESQLLHDLGFPISANEITARHSGLSPESQRRDLESMFGRPLPNDFEKRTAAAIYDAFEAELRAIDGVAMALEAIGGPRCVASSSPPDRLRHSLELVGLYDSFAPHVFSAHGVERGKPAPDLFLFAARRLRASPAECVVIEDSRFGIQAARAAGMAALGFVGGRHCGVGRADELASAGAHFVFEHMSELPGLIEAGLGAAGR